METLQGLPREVLEKAVQLDGAQKKIFLSLFMLGKPAKPSEIAERLSLARAYVHMRLIQLEQLHFVRKIQERSRRGRCFVKFEVVL